MDISGISGVGGLAGSPEQDRGAGIPGGGREPWRRRFIAFRAQRAGGTGLSGSRDLSSDTGTDHGWRDRGGGRMVFYCDWFFSGANRKFYTFFIGDHFLQCVQPFIYGRILHRRWLCPAEKASIPSLSASSGTLAGAFLKKERRLEASFTVEAALVLALVFMVMGMAIKEAYTIHDEITGSMILEEALERASYNRDEKKEDTYFTGQAEEQGNPRLWLGEYSARLKRKTGKISGYASAGAWTLELERGAFHPELFLRRTAALVEMGNNRDDGGSGVQTGNEPELYGPKAGTGEK